MVRDSKVIIWHAFPSPSGKRKLEQVPQVPARLTTSKPKTQSQLDEEAVDRWMQLADIIIDGRPTKKKSKRRIVA